MRVWFYLFLTAQQLTTQKIQAVTFWPDSCGRAAASSEADSGTGSGDLYFKIKKGAFRILGVSGKQGISWKLCSRMCNTHFLFHNAGPKYVLFKMQFSFS